MTYQLTLRDHPGYLLAAVTGANTAENAARFLRETYAACVERGFTAALLHMDLSGPSLTIGEIFSVIVEGAKTGRLLARIGYVDENRLDRIKIKFAETVARNRAVNVRLFDALADAHRWLAEHAQD